MNKPAPTQSTPARNITITALAIFALLLIASVVLILTDNRDVGGMLLGVALGQIGGTAATTAVVVHSNSFPVDNG